METVQGLIDFIRAELRIQDDLDPATPLLSSGLVDSLSVVVLLGAIEDEFDVVIDESAVAIDSFDTPEQIFAHIESATGRG